MANVVVIGNAPINLGPKIDSFDIVCRVHEYMIDCLKEKGMSDKIGTKTNILYVLRSNYKKAKKKVEKSVKIKILDPSIKERLSKKYDNYARSGLVAIFQTLKKFGPPVHICGFEFDNNKKIKHSTGLVLMSYNEKTKVKGYPYSLYPYNKGWGVSRFENPELEGKLIEEHVKSGDIKWLQ